MLEKGAHLTAGDDVLDVPPVGVDIRLRRSICANALYMALTREKSVRFVLKKRSHTRVLKNIINIFKKGVYK